MHKCENYDELTPLFPDDLHDLKVGDKLVRVMVPIRGHLELGDILTIKELGNGNYDDYPSFIAVFNPEYSRSSSYVVDAEFYYKYAKYEEENEDQKFLSSLF